MSLNSPSSPHHDRVRIGHGFRTVLPPLARERFQLAEGGELIVEVDEFGVHLFTFEQAARRAAALIAQYVDPSRSLVDELIAERRLEASRE